MKIRSRRSTTVWTIRFLLLATTFVCCMVAFASAGTISLSDKCAWSENAGWFNFRPTNGGVVVNSSYLSGYAWHENLGWLKVGSDAGGPYENTTANNWGVNRDAAGNLSGYAWSEGWGWIKFNPTGGGVTIDPVTGAFDGYAWGENIGWVKFRSPQGALVSYGVGLAYYTLNLVFSGTGAGTATSTVPPFSCNTDCTRKFFDITPLTLTAEASQYSIFGSWIGCDSANDNICNLLLDQDRPATVTFTKDTAHTTRIDGAPPTYYQTLQSAYDHVVSGSTSTIQVWGIELPESLVCGVSNQVTIQGGFDQLYQDRSGVTTIHGLTIRNGTVKVNRIVVK